MRALDSTFAARQWQGGAKVLKIHQLTAPTNKIGEHKAKLAAEAASFFKIACSRRGVLPAVRAQLQLPIAGPGRVHAHHAVALLAHGVPLHGAGYWCITI